METKPFSYNLYSQSDNKAKNLAAEFLTSRGFTVYDDRGELYKDGDLVVRHPKLKSNKAVLVEVEQKHNWTDQNKWQGFITVDVPYRKKYSKSKLYILFNHYWNMLAFTSMNYILNSSYSRKNTKYTENEIFFNVPVYRFVFYKLEDKRWVKIKE